MSTKPIRYVSSDEDSARWLDFNFRDGDIVVSTRSKSGTTWVQMICALLIFQDPALPRPLAELSPWLDWLILPKDQLFADLGAQTHRRFIKTHTPLDGLPLSDHATFIVVARHPLDAAVLLYHQSHNINRWRIADLTGNPDLARPKRLLPLDQWLAEWIASDAPPNKNLESFNGVFHHLTDAWSRMGSPNVVMVHYDDLLRDLNGEMARIAEHLDIQVDADRIGELSQAATFASMQDNAGMLAPDPADILADHSKFFRGGRSGDGISVLSQEAVDAYRSRAFETAPEDLLEWLHRH